MIRSKGFTLVEALIALLVLSFGLLGVAAMQLKSLQSATIGYQRSAMSLAAIDAQERVWGELSGDCSIINIGNIEAEWRTVWFERDTPLRNGSGDIDPDLSGVNCEYTVSIDLGGSVGSEALTYMFRVPSPGGT